MQNNKKIRLICSKFAALVLGGCLTHSAYAAVSLPPAAATAAAAVSGNLPASIAPERAGQAISSALPSKPARALQAAPTAPAASQQALGPQAESIRFELKQIVIEDAHVYPESQLRTLYQSKLNTVITVAELQEIVQNITNYYRNNGYILSRAVLPPQSISGGIVHIRVIEGYIDHVTVTGNAKGARALVQQYGDKIVQSRPLQLRTMEHYMRLLNDIPGVSVKAVLEPSKTVTGASDLALTTQTQTFSGFASYDNYGTKYLGPTELTIGGQANSIFRSGDKVQVVVAGTDKTDELRYDSFLYDSPLGTSGLRFIVGNNYTRTSPGFILTPLHIVGVSNTAYATMKYPLLVSRTQNITLQSDFNYLDSTVTALSAELYTDHIRTLDLGGTYDFPDPLRGANSVNLMATQGLNILNATQPSNLNVSRAGGKAVFTRFNLQATHIQPIYGRFSAFALVQSQYSLMPLLTSQQYGFGGSQIGRGYDPSEIIGDQGLAGSAELRMDTVPGKLLLQAVQYYAFYDVGKVWNIKTLGQPSRAAAASTGLGARIFLTKNFSGNFMIAKPLTRVVAAQNVRGNGKASRVFFSVTASI